MQSAITVCLVPEAKSGPFVFHGDLEVACAKASELGFNAIELFPPSGDTLDVRILRQILHRSRLEIAAVGTGAGWVTRRLSLTHSDPSIRRQAREFIRGMIDFAAEFKAPTIIGSMQGRAEGSVEREQALGWLAEALDELGLAAHGHGVPLLLEPLNRYESNLLNTVKDAQEFLRRLPRSNLRLLCDLFHMNIEEASIPTALRAAGELVGHVHFADSNRQAIGCGHLDIFPVAEALREIGYRGYLSAEILPLPTAQEAAQQTITSFRTLFPAG